MRLESLIHGVLLRTFNLLTCEEVEKISYDFLEERLPKVRMAQMHLHMITCPQCLRFMRSYRKTRQLGENLPRPSLPKEFKDSMLEFLMAERITSPAT